MLDLPDKYITIILSTNWKFLMIKYLGNNFQTLGTGKWKPSERIGKIWVQTKISYSLAS